METTASEVPVTKKVHDWAKTIGYQHKGGFQEKDFQNIASGVLRPCWGQLIKHYHPRARDIRRQLKLNSFNAMTRHHQDEDGADVTLQSLNQKLNKKLKKLEGSIEFHKNSANEHVMSLLRTGSEDNVTLSNVETFRRNGLVMNAMIRKLQEEKKFINLKIDAVRTQYNSLVTPNEVSQEELKEVLLATVKKLIDAIRSNNIAAIQGCLPPKLLSSSISSVQSSIMAWMITHQELPNYFNSLLSDKEEKGLKSTITRKQLEALENRCLMVGMEVQVRENKELLSQKIQDLVELAKNTFEFHLNCDQLENVLSLSLRRGVQKYLVERLNFLKEREATSSPNLLHEETFNCLKATQEAMKTNIKSLIIQLRKEHDYSIPELYSLPRTILQTAHDLKEAVITETIASLTSTKFLETPSNLLSPQITETFTEELPLIVILRNALLSHNPEPLKLAASLLDQQQFVSEIQLLLQSESEIDVISNKIRDMIHVVEQNYAGVIEDMVTTFSALNYKDELIVAVRATMMTWLNQPVQHRLQKIEDGSSLLKKVIDTLRLKNEMKNYEKFAMNYQ